MADSPPVRLPPEVLELILALVPHDRLASTPHGLAMRDWFLANTSDFDSENLEADRIIRLPMKSGRCYRWCDHDCPGRHPVWIEEHDVGNFIRYSWLGRRGHGRWFTNYDSAPVVPPPLHAWQDRVYQRMMQRERA